MSRRPAPSGAHVDALRAFNRFYTRKIGTLKEGLLDSAYSLTEVRVLYELAHRAGPTATELCTDLGLDPGYLSRMLRRFEKAGLLKRETASDDTRRAHLHLSPRGAQVFAELNRRSSQEMHTAIAHLGEAERTRLIEHLHSARALLANEPDAATPTLRDPQPGDLGWVVEHHGALYAQEYGWDARFEGLVARIVADYAGQHDSTCERCWIAEQGGRRVGCVFLVRHSRTVAKLRLLLVDPTARGHGLGGQLIAACVEFARASGYRKIVLWTNSVLTAARHLYEKAGFTLVKSEPHESFGQKLVGETWELKLEK